MQLMHTRWPIFAALVAGGLVTAAMWYAVLANPNVTLPLNLWSNLGLAAEVPPGSGQFRFTDLQATNYPRRFYQVQGP